MLPIFKNLSGGMTVLTLLINNFGTGVTLKNSSMISKEADAGRSKSGFDLVHQLSIKSNAIIKPFAKLMTKLNSLEKSICDHDCEELFVVAYRSIEAAHIDDSHNAKALEGIRSLYSIRKAICETRATVAEIPQSCINLLPKIEFTASRQSMIELELELARSSTVPACLKRLREHHYFWTSYSNNLQESNTMADLFRSDIELRSMVMTYRDFEASINDLHNELANLRQHNMAWFEEAERNAHVLFDAQDDAFNKFVESFRSSSKLASSELELIGSTLYTHQKTLRETSSIASEQMAGIVKNLSAINLGVAGMQRNVVQLYSDVAVEIARLTQSHKGALEHALVSISNKLSPVVRKLDELDVRSDSLSTYFLESEELHSLNVKQLQEQSGLSAAMLTQLTTSFNLINSTGQIVEQISAQAQDLGSIMNGAAHFLLLVEQYGEILMSVGTYMAFCLFIAPFDGGIVPAHIVSKFKAVFGAILVTNLILVQLQLWNHHFIQFIDALNPSLSRLLTVSMLLLAVVLWYFIRFLLSHPVLDAKPDALYDVELAHRCDWAAIGPEPYRCDRQQQRMDLLSRSVRYGSTPPGL